MLDSMSPGNGEGKGSVAESNGLSAGLQGYLPIGVNKSEMAEAASSICRIGIVGGGV